ncbi:MAG: beta-galactosidase, partial [Granulosicoccaceae bacterium]
MKLGVCWYPEHWPESDWARDVTMMRENGISVVRVGEFAWSRFQPTEHSALRFDWLDRAVETLHQQGMQVVMGTPTACPPKWLVNADPGILACDARGRARGFGSRRHYSFSSESYRQRCHTIVEAMAEHYGQHPAIVAWQTDNEYGCHSTILDYSDNAASAFRVWCRRKYDNIDALNLAWSNVFWSMEYATFDEIDPPVEAVTELNPAHQLAFWRFSSDQVASFNAEQVAILRRLAPGR